MDEWINTHTNTHTHTEEHYSAIKKNEILPSATTWMDPKGIMLSETSQTEKDKYCMIHLYVESKNKDLMDIEKRLVVA